jgi:hypothetical protein
MAAPDSFRAVDPGGDPGAGARHARWLKMLSAADWTRIRAAARMMNAAYVPPVLRDLDAPLHVAVCPTGQERRFAGERIGSLRGGQAAVLVSEKPQG